MPETLNPADGHGPLGRSPLRPLLGSLIVLDRLPELMAQVCDPACPEFNAATPWREGEDVYASDGCMTVRCLASQLTPRALAEVPGWDPTRPKDFGATLQKLGPFVDDARALPNVPFEPPKCRACDGRGRSGVLIGNPKPCPTCRGTGRRARSGEGVHLGGFFHLDRWYVALLNAHGAKAYPPKSAKGVAVDGSNYVVGAIEFRVDVGTAKPLVGYVTTWVPSVPRPSEAPRTQAPPGLGMLDLRRSRRPRSGGRR